MSSPTSPTSSTGLRSSTWQDKLQGSYLNRCQAPVLSSVAAWIYTIWHRAQAHSVHRPLPPHAATPSHLQYRFRSSRRTNRVVFYRHHQGQPSSQRTLLVRRSIRQQCQGGRSRSGSAATHGFPWTATGVAWATECEDWWVVTKQGRKHRVMEELEVRGDERPNLGYVWNTPGATIHFLEFGPLYFLLIWIDVGSIKH